jgi:hypothetical protein
MRYGALIFLIVCGACDDDGVGGTDLSVPAISDAAAPIVDLASLDLLPPPPPPACSLPAPREYLEQISYQYVQIGGGGGGPVSAYYGGPVVVSNRGQIVRPKTPLASASYRCEFTEVNVDENTCTAACCPGQPSSPIVYVDSAGWSIWQSGSCAYTAGALQYVATITTITTTPAH